ncbi:catalase [Sistotremastrum suecicum HHB10207 ss-3]|uniref:Catalase n=1 Tax=Sistotremastrum suecicum HHB10207 ss-3 TaxID=1314776 RepID=A0A166JA96_9AGAM|nr:catalase [Sistotremastrum suecicum HHB10207 ss-3]
MSSIAQTAKNAFTTMTQTEKVAQLSNNFTVNTEASGAHLTTDHGTAVADTDNWLRVTDGTKHGPSLLEDQIAREKIHRFDHERIPERVVHARQALGAAAHGYFKVYDNSASKYSYAGVLTDPSRTTPVFLRFSTVAGSAGSADTVRDVRGFAVKFYTQEGNWDIVGNDIPVFFIQDAIKFPDLIHAVKPEPHNGVPQAQSAHNNFWDFAFQQPETSHMLMWTMSDRGIPRSYRMVQGFGVNTFTTVNAEGKRFFVKFHFVPELGVHSLMWDEALKICGQDPDFHRKDLNEAIDNGAYPKWKFGMQIIPEGEEDKFEFDILDATKVWPEELVPVEFFGELVLNRTVDEYFPETEQVAFCTSHVVPGIGFSDDPLLQGRNFSYFDTQITRLGINWQELPINRPVCPVMNFNRDGQGQHRIHKGTVNYWPNRLQAAPPKPVAQGGYYDYPQKVGGLKQRARGAKFNEYFNQAQLFYNSLAPIEKMHLIKAISFELDHCDDPQVYISMTKRLAEIDLDLAQQVAENVGGEKPSQAARQNHGKKSKNLSQFDLMPENPTIETRRIAILVADGFDFSFVEAMRASILGAKALPFLIGPRRGSIASSDSKLGSLPADHHFEGMRSTMFDAVIIPPGEKHVNTLAKNGRAIHWVREAFGHCKTIGAAGEGVWFLRTAVNLPGVDFANNGSGDAVTSSYGVVTTEKYSFTSSALEPIKFATGNGGFLSNFATELSKHRCWARELDGLTEQVAY